MERSKVHSSRVLQMKLMACNPAASREVLGETRFQSNDLLISKCPGVKSVSNLYKGLTILAPKAMRNLNHHRMHYFSNKINYLSVLVHISFIMHILCTYSENMKQLTLVPQNSVPLKHHR